MAKTKTTTEEEIRAYTIGELQPLTQPIIICDYDLEWPALFEREATRIRATLGDQVKLLEHVGCVLPSHPGKHSHRIRAAIPIVSGQRSVTIRRDQGLLLRQTRWRVHARLGERPVLILLEILAAQSRSALSAVQDEIEALLV